jgi:hypothetical protein
MKKLIPALIAIMLVISGCGGPSAAPAVSSPAPQETQFTESKPTAQTVDNSAEDLPLPTVYSVTPLQDREVPEFSRVLQKKADGLFDKPFEMDHAETGTLSLGVSAGVYEAGELPDVFAKVLSDIERIAEVTDVYGGPVAVYIIDVPAETGYYAKKNAVICAKSAFEDSSYLFALSQAMYGNCARWFGIGIAGLANGIKPGEQALREYYAGTDDLSLLGLSSLRFEPAWCDEEDLKLARDTSIAMCEYTLETYGPETLVFGITDAVKTEWLRSIGVDKAFSYPYSEVLNNFICSEPESDKFAVTMTSARDKFNLNYVEKFFENAGQTEAFINDNQAGREKIIEFLKSEAPEFSNKMDLDVSITYDICSGSSVRKHGWNGSGVISFYYDPLYHLHECVHGMLGTPERNHWIDEGLAVYFSNIYYPSELTMNEFRKRMQYCAENSGVILEAADPRKIDFAACEYYLNNGGNIEQLDMRLAIDAYAYSTLSNPGIDYSDCFSSPTYAENHIMRARRLEADELSYHQAGSFVAFLIDNYSLTAVLDYALDKQDFESAFGKSYSELKQMWLEYLGV